LFAALLLGAGVAAAQQTPATVQQTPSATLHPRTAPPVRTINLDVVVTRKGGGPVAGLQAKDFTLLDNKTPQPITSFQAYEGEQAPVEVMLLLDSVNTDFNVMAQMRIEIDKFLLANGGQLARPLALALLDEQGGIKMQRNYTRDGKMLAKSLDASGIGLREVGRSAGIEGAAERFDDSMKALRMIAAYESGQPGRKIVLWVSPGWHLLSGPEVDLTSQQEDAIFSEITWFSMAFRDTETTIYAINPLGVNESVAQAFYYEEFLDGVRKPGDVNYGNLGLQVLAIQSGGLAVSSTDVSGLLRRAVEDTQAYYRISFEPPPTPRRDVYHKLEIKVDQPGVVVRTSTGYYDEP
jgi:VWFA-related protein